MNKKDKLDKLFDRLEGHFDVEEPNTGHQDRFLRKLNETKTPSAKPGNRLIRWWKPLSIAASILILLTFGLNISNDLNRQATAEVPEEIEKARFYFTTLINKEIEKINAEATPDTKKVIEDAMKQIKKLEEDYKTLEKSLVEDGNTKQLLHAMITNFQIRISLLEDVLEQIENVKQLKQTEYENIAI